MMTTMAALMGTLADCPGVGRGRRNRGARWALRWSAGWCVSQLLTLYITPVMYIYLDSFGRWLRTRRWFSSSASRELAARLDSPHP